MNGRIIFERRSLRQVQWLESVHTRWKDSRSIFLFKLIRALYQNVTGIVIIQVVPERLLWPMRIHVDRKRPIPEKREVITHRPVYGRRARAVIILVIIILAHNNHLHSFEAGCPGLNLWVAVSGCILSLLQFHPPAKCRSGGNSNHVNGMPDATRHCRHYLYRSLLFCR